MALKDWLGSRVVLWGSGGVFLAICLSLAYLLALPVIQVHFALKAYEESLSQDKTTDPQIAIDRLGGPRQAARKLTNYLRTSERLAQKKNSALGILADLGADGGEATDVLIGMLNEPSEADRQSTEKEDALALRIRAAQVLGLVRPATSRVVPALRAALSDREAEVRSVAAWALARVDPEGSLDALAQLLHDPDPTCRVTAAEELGKLGSAARTTLLALHNAATDESEKDVRIWMKVAAWKIQLEPFPVPKANGELRTRLAQPVLFVCARTPFAEAMQSFAASIGTKANISPGLAAKLAGHVVKGFPVEARIRARSVDLALDFVGTMVGCDWTVKDGQLYFFDPREVAEPQTSKEADKPQQRPRGRTRR